ncbi:MAG TPA: hypothetical protein VFS08_07500 [Gemmatimonadaceae bacterium]|nr:hypothetical protein [Gemmatimonadaceae bacterium]
MSRTPPSRTPPSRTPPSHPLPRRAVARLAARARRSAFFAIAVSVVASTLAMQLIAAAAAHGAEPRHVAASGWSTEQPTSHGSLAPAGPDALPADAGGPSTSR